MIFDNKNSSFLHLLPISSIYFFLYSSLPITTPKCFCPDDIFLMLVLSNVSAAFKKEALWKMHYFLILGSSCSYFLPAFVYRHNFFSDVGNNICYIFIVLNWLSGIIGYSYFFECYLKVLFYYSLLLSQDHFKNYTTYLIVKDILK